MCGIVGFSGKASAASLSEAVRSLAHRGPDDHGSYVDEQAAIGLGHTRLSIVDLTQSGHQPMIRAQGQVVLTYNGEIYNFPALREELIRGGVTFEGRSDTEVLINLYLAHGAAMLSRLNGIFAFAIWDARDNTMLVARDALGVKPLYFTENAQGFAFASEIKALCRLMPQAKDLDAASIHRYLTYLWCPGDGTPLRAVRKLQPGEAMIVKAGRVQRRWTWYQLPAFRSPHLLDNEADAIAQLREHLASAVEKQMLADVPVGAFLSGGLDSSALVALASKINPDIRCFTINSSGGDDDGTTPDLPYARQVAAHLKVPLDIVEIDSATMANDLQSMVRQLDEPLADPSALNVLYISQLARRNGIKVLLSGSGGDDLFTGYRRHLALEMEQYWDWLPRPVRKMLGSASGLLDQSKPTQRRIAKILSGLALDGDDRLTNYFVWSKHSDLMRLYTPEFRDLVGQQRSDEPMRGFMQALPEHTSDIERMLTLEQRFFLADHNLCYTDKMSMATGVEVRVPYLDLEVVEFAARIPATMKQRGREGKWILKKAMEPLLPKDVIYRPKTGFGAPLRRWMRHELRSLLGDVLSRESLARRGIFNADGVHDLIEANDKGRVDASYTLLSMLCVELWCREFVDAA